MNEQKNNQIKMTEYSHGAGCGCKLSPAVLSDILADTKDHACYEKLLVGNQTNDDAAAFDLDGETVILSTTDFFMPIVDDPYTFGKIAATNAISDIYAMGGNPIMAIAILGWPVDKLPANVASQVMAGGKDVCKAAGIPLAGGHSIDSPEPIFGLAVTGTVKKSLLKRNDSATEDCVLYLTKPLGIGVLTTAQKRKKIEDNDIEPAIKAMCTLNKLGQEIAHLEGVMAVTDITGFGLLGHLSEMCEGSHISAVIEFDAVPRLPKVDYYVNKGCVSGGTIKNFNSYGHKLSKMSENAQHILCDAQTSGGLLIAVKKEHAHSFEAHTHQLGYHLKPIGYTTTKSDTLIQVNE